MSRFQILLGAAVALAVTVGARADDLVAVEQTAMAKLSFMDGVWRGPATTQTQSGPHSVTQTERIGPFLNGTVKVIEGRGYQADGAVGFNALGIISFDPATQKYAFRSYAEGRAGTFSFEPTEACRSERRQPSVRTDRERLCMGNPGGAHDHSLHGCDQGRRLARRRHAHDGW